MTASTRSGDGSREAERFTVRPPVRVQSGTERIEGGPDVGDVFTVPIDDRRRAVGQVVAAYGRGTHYVMISDAVVEDGQDPLAALEAGQDLFLALCSDARLDSGRWRSVAHTHVGPGLRFPAHREMTDVNPEQYDVVDHAGTRRRPATHAEVRLLRERHFVPPSLIEEALRARHGLARPHSSYADIELPGPNTSEATFFGP